MAENGHADYPTRTFRHSANLPYPLAGVVTVILSQVLVQVIDRMAPFFGGLPVGIRVILPFFLLLAIGFMAFRIASRLKFDRPVLVISPEGVQASMLGSDIIPWRAISKVTLERTGKYGIIKLIALALREDVDPEQRCHWAKIGPFYSDGSHVRISVNYLEGITASELVALVKQYHEAFCGMAGNSDASRPGFASSRWTGLAD